MERKSVKKCISWLLALAMVFTLVPVSSMGVEAAVKPTLSSAQVTIAKGMSQTVKVKNAAKGAKTKWKSDDAKTASVSASGVIKGVKDGKTTVRCTVTVSGKKTTLKCKVTVKTPKFAKSEYSVGQGEKLKLSLTNKYSGSTYQWSSDNKKIVTVNQKGQVTGVSTGTAKVTVKIAIPKKGTRKAKTITKKVSVTVSDTTEVTTQTDLEAALKNASCKKIAIRTDEQTELIIPEGTYSKVALTVDAPNADIVNYGVFKSITIKQIAADTWTERAQDNVLILDASAGHIVIPDDAGIKEVRIVNANSSFKLDVAGNVDQITISSESKVEINVSGTVGKVDVNSRTTVSITGESASAIAVSVGENANGTTVNSNVKLEVTSGSDTEINLSKGAEGSSVKTTNADKSVEVTNNTASTVAITNKDGATQTVDSGKNATVNGSGEVTGSTAEDAGSGAGAGGGGAASGGGGASSGGTSSSGNLTRVVTGFQSVRAVEAGIYGTTLKSVEELEQSFPTTMIGKSTSGDVEFQVLSWKNTDDYSPDTAVGGYYTFTAVLGEASVVNTIQTGVSATIKVWVKAQVGAITYPYITEYGEEVDKFAFIELFN